MLSNILDRISFYSLFLVAVLLPVFFLPFTKIPVDISKGLLLVIGLSVSIIFWTAARFSDGKIVLPKSWLLVSGFSFVGSFLSGFKNVFFRHYVWCWDFLLYVSLFSSNVFIFCCFQKFEERKNDPMGNDHIIGCCVFVSGFAFIYA